MANTSDTNLSAEDAGLQNVYHIPDFVGELNDAKLFLQQASSETGDNLFDHLGDVLNKILAERPQNVIDFFEEYSRKVKEQRYRSQLDHLQDLYVAPGRYDYTMKIMPMLKMPSLIVEPSTAEPEEDLSDPSKRDLMQLFYYCEKAGVVLPQTELYYIQLAMKRLMATEKLADVRFWGKIYGLGDNYIVVETELSEEELEKRNKPPEPVEPLEETPSKEENAAKEEAELAVEDYGEGGEIAAIDKSNLPRPLPPLPLPQHTPPVPVPIEPSGEGPNKKVKIPNVSTPGLGRRTFRLLA